MNWNGIMLRKGRRYDGEVVRAKIPGHSSFDYFAVRRGRADFRRPLRFVVDDPDTKHGHYEYV